MAVTSRPRLRKTSINLGNFGGGSVLGNVSPLQSKVSSSSHIKSLQSQRRILERVIDLEDEVDDLGTRIKMQDESLLDVRKSLTNIRKSILTLQDGQKVIIDNAREKEKIEKEIRKKEEQRLKRQEAEGALEADTGADDIKKTDGSVEKKGKESMGFLDTIKNFFMFTIAGWFTDKAIKLVNAFASGNKDVINSIGKKLLGGLAGIGSLMLIAVAGIGPVLAGIGSLIGVLAGLLFNPVTLTALLIAVGIGGAVLGIKKLWDWGRNKATGGQAFTDKHKELDQKLRDAGMTSKGLIVNDSGMGKHTNRTEEQERILQEVQAEREKLNSKRDAMNDEIKAARREWKDNAIANKPEGGKVDWKTENAKWKNIEAGIKRKHTSNISSSVGNGGNVSQNINTSDVTSRIGPEPSSEGNITVIPLQKEQEISASSDGRATSVDYISSDNPNNIHTLSSKIQYGVVAG